MALLFIRLTRVISFLSGNCSNPLNAGPVNDTSIQNACNPFRNSVKISTFHKKMKSGQVFEFFYLEWDLCQAAIDRLRGYKVYCMFFYLSFSFNFVIFV